MELMRPGGSGDQQTVDRPRSRGDLPRHLEAAQEMAEAIGMVGIEGHA
jgi:hypothetical protein